jgi:hypothetical protein
MKYAYADPPYPGMANYYPEKTEVDHADLLRQLNEFDGWALSTASSTLQYVLTLCPEDVRIGSWTKTFCSFKPSQRVFYAWEPVIFYGARGKEGKEKGVRDWIACRMTFKKGIMGVKPLKFCSWILEVLGVKPEDEFTDIFPGTEIMSRALDIRRSQLRIDQLPLKEDKS